MKQFFLLLALSPGLAQAIPPKAIESLKVEPGIEAPFPAWKQAETGVLEVEVVNRDRSSGREVLHMQNSFRVKRLPSAKAGVLRQELRFDSYRMRSQPLREGMGPVDMDLTSRLKGLRLVINWRGDKVLGIEGLEKARTQVLKGADAPSRQVLESLLNEEQLRNQMSRRNETGCFQKAPGQKVGAKWKTRQPSGNGAELEVECQFVGWGKVNGKPFLLIRGTVHPLATAPKDGAPPVRTSGKIDYYASPKGEEFLVVNRMQMEMEKNAMDLTVTAHFHPW